MRILKGCTNCTVCVTDNLKMANWLMSLTRVRRKRKGRRSRSQEVFSTDCIFEVNFFETQLVDLLTEIFSKFCIFKTDPFFFKTILGIYSLVYRSRDFLI